MDFLSASILQLKPKLSLCRHGKTRGQCIKLSALFNVLIRVVDKLSGQQMVVARKELFIVNWPCAILGFRKSLHLNMYETNVSIIAKCGWICSHLVRLLSTLISSDGVTDINPLFYHVRSPLYGLLILVVFSVLFVSYSLFSFFLHLNGINDDS